MPHTYGARPSIHNVSGIAEGGITDADEAWNFITGIDGAVSVHFSENSESRGWALIIHELDDEEVLANYSLGPDGMGWIYEYFNEAYERNSR